MSEYARFTLGETKPLGSWKQTKFGARLTKNLPITYDSIKSAETVNLLEELRQGECYVSKPTGSFGPLWLRIYHAWLVVTSRAMAVQFTEDHFRMADIEMVKHD